MSGNVKKLSLAKVSHSEESERISSERESYQGATAVTQCCSHEEKASSFQDDQLSVVSKKPLELPFVQLARERLNFPLKFEKQAFCLDFRSSNGSSTSDCEPTSLRHFRLGIRTGLGNVSPKTTKSQFASLKKKFSSAEKVKRNPFRGRVLRSAVGSDAPD